MQDCPNARFYFQDPYKNNSRELQTAAPRIYQADLVTPKKKKNLCFGRSGCDQPDAAYEHVDNCTHLKRYLQLRDLNLYMLNKVEDEEALLELFATESIWRRSNATSFYKQALLERVSTFERIVHVTRSLRNRGILCFT